MFRKIIGRVMPVYEGEGVNNGAPPPVVPPPVVPPAPPAHPVTAPWKVGEEWKIGEGDAAQPWYNAIPEEGVRAGIAAKGYKTPAELAMAYTNLMAMQRNPDGTVQLPAADATPEQLNEFYTKLGRPAEKSAYDLKMPDGLPVDPKLVDFAKDVSFELGLNPTQAQKLADKWNEFAPTLTGETVAEANQKNEADISALETRWGADLAANKEAGLRVVKALGPEATAIVDKVDSVIGTAAVVELLAMIGRKSDEGTLTGAANGGDPNDPASMSKEQAQAKAQQLQGDPAFLAKYTDKNHPEHASALSYMEKLFARS